MSGKVQELILENFKSYQGRVSVEFWRKFTCVVGPNGSGKSNLIDAISFVLCVEARHLVGERLRDLIHRKESEAAGDVMRDAVVELVYVEQGTDKSSQTSTRFRRSIQSDGTVSLHLNGDPIELPDYTSRLEAIHILSKVRNFLVFQGDVESVARRQGRDLTAFFEQVSGSCAFREEYDQLASEKAQKEEIVRTVNNKKRNALNERKRMSRQTEEAKAYQDLEKKLEDMRVEHFLFRLLCIKRRSESARVTYDQRVEELVKASRQVEAADASLKAKDAQRAQARLAIKEADRNAARARAELDNLTPESVKVQSKLSFSRERLEDLRQQSRREEARNLQLGEQVDALKKEEKKIEADLVEVTREKEEQKVLFTPAQLEEFRNAQALAERETAEPSAKVRELEGSIRAVASDHAQRKVEVREGRARRDQLRKRIDELTESERELSRAYDSKVQEAQAVKDRMETAETQAGGYADEKKRLLQTREELVEGIQDITANERQINRDRTLAQTSEDLKKLVPGVHGRVIELSKPNNRKHQTALNVALGGYADAIIVDTFDAGRKCVAYLRERMLEPMTFLPMDKLRVAPADQRLWAAASSQNDIVMALKCLSFDSPYGKAFEFLLGDVVLADSLDAGRQFAFGELRRLNLGCRVVTLDGETISRDGNLSVSYDAGRGGSRFDFRKLDESKRHLEDINRRLLEIQKLEASEAGDANAMQAKVRDLEARKFESEVALKQVRQELAHRQRELKETESDLEVSEPELSRVEKKEADLREEQRVIEESISQVVSKHFARLSAEKGVDDVRLYEREWRRNRGDTQRRHSDLSQRLGSVQAELKIMEQALREQAVGKAREAMATCQAEIEALERANADFTERKTALEQQVTPVVDKIKRLEAEEIQCEKEVSQLRERAAEERQHKAKVEKLQKEAQAELQVQEDAQAKELRRATVEDVELPRLPSGDGEAPREGADAPDAGNAGPLDFSLVPEHIRNVVTESVAHAAGGQVQAVQLLEREYQSKLRQLDAELQRIRPNMKAIDQLSQANEDFEDLVKEAVTAREQLEEVEGRFEHVRAERIRLFMECFLKVSAEIGTIYKRLTENASNHDGGSAYLDLEDQTDPFAAGVKFTAIPPAKRYTDIGELSGGERTLAAIALLFAVHAFKRPPFLVLDEVDAHLDAYNMQAFAGYVARCDVQTVVISLKAQLYTSCEGLVGVSKNKYGETSVLFTVDLLGMRQGNLPALAASPARTVSPGSHPPLAAPSSDGRSTRPPLAPPSSGRSAAPPSSPAQRSPQAPPSSRASTVPLAPPSSGGSAAPPPSPAQRSPLAPPSSRGSAAVPPSPAHSSRASAAVPPSPAHSRRTSSSAGTASKSGRGSSPQDGAASDRRSPSARTEQDKGSSSAATELVPTEIVPSEVLEGRLPTEVIPTEAIPNPMEGVEEEEEKGPDSRVAEGDVYPAPMDCEEEEAHELAEEADEDPGSPRMDVD